MRKCIVAVLTVVLLCTACNVSSQPAIESVPEVPTPPSVNVTLNKDRLILMKGTSDRLKAEFSDGNGDAYEVQWSSDAPDIAGVDADGTVSGINEGVALITVCVKELNLTSTCSVYVRSGYILDVPFIAQNPAFPTGCESVSATMALQYYGVDIIPGVFVDICLTRGPALYTDENGKRRGPSPYDCFIGDPRKNTGFGCYAPVIEKGVNRALVSTDLMAKQVNGKTVAELCSEYIDYGTPVIFWATMWMREPYSGARWYLDDGTEFVWTAPEHCLVLAGYDGEYYYFNDPLDQKQTRYARAAVEKAYDGLGRQAVVIVPKE